MPAKHRYQTPAIETEEGQKRENNYHLALGRFVANYAFAEAVMQEVLRYYAKTKSRVARVIFTGIRTDVAINDVRGLIETAKITKTARDELDYVFKQLASINTARNEILHYGARGIAEGDGFVTNEFMKPDHKATKFPISPSHLDDMSFDTRKIIVHLRVNHSGHPPSETVRRFFFRSCTLHGDINISRSRYDHVRRQTFRMVASALQYGLTSRHHLGSDLDGFRAHAC
jgi:hypothetical protein